MKREKIEVGAKFGKLTVIGDAECLIYNKRKHSASLCKCECGNIKVISNSHLRSGRSKSCGCSHFEKKGHVDKFTCRGYVFVYRPNHHEANEQGYVKEHRLVMEKFLGRKLTDDEVVHHKDLNKGNNDIANLQLVSRHEHSMIHARLNAERKGKEFHEVKRCKMCGKEIRRSSELCYECAGKKRRKVERPKKEVLEAMIKEIPFTDIAKRYGVSSNAVKKWVEKFGINVGSRMGYWTKYKKTI